jgi:threonine/homoserine/homoserine lactone efflux protein
MELGLQNLWLFVLAGWVLNLTPGPDVFYQITHALKGGVRAGCAAMAGILAGCLVHVAAATLGVSALIAASSAAFTALKWVGAAYLVYVGIQMLRSQVNSSAPNLVANNALNTPATGQKHYKNIFIQGFWTNALNPKVAIFFLAFLPQFISPGSSHTSLAFAVLGLLFILNSVPINLGYVLLASWVSQRMQHNAQGFARAMLWLERTAGALFVGFGVKLALSER